MVKHIVFFRLKDSAHGNDKATNARLVKEKLEALGGKIPGLLHIEVGVDFSAEGDAADIALYSEFESKAALDAYKVHPEHLAVVPFVTEARLGRNVVDYEI